jgi:hypothetical protein
MKGLVPILALSLTLAWPLECMCCPAVSCGCAAEKESGQCPPKGCCSKAEKARDCAKLAPDKSAITSKQNHVPLYLGTVVSLKLNSVTFNPLSSFIPKKNNPALRDLFVLRI